MGVLCWNMGFKYENGGVYFVTYKTFNAEKYFIDAIDKGILMAEIYKAKNDFKLKIFSLAILSNHYHVLLKCSDWISIHKVWRQINGGASFLINNRHGLRRKIWGDKFNWAVKDEEAFNKFLGYILGNPLKHGLVKSLDELRDYEFSNYKEVVEEYGQDYIDSLIVLGQKFDFEEPNNWENVRNKVFNE